MNGLDKITQMILSEARQQQGEILEQAQRQCETMREEAALQRRKTEETAREHAKKEAERLRMQVRSEARQEAHRLHLETRALAVREIIGQARRNLEALPDDEYASWMLKLVVRYAQPGQGELLFSEKERNRLPSDFAVRCNLQLSGRRVALSPEPAGIGAGFCIRYGLVEENCTLDSLFEAQEEKLGDVVRAALESGEEGRV